VQQRAASKHCARAARSGKYKLHMNNNHKTRLTALCPVTTRMSLYQKGKTYLDFTEARDSEWQWRQLGHMQVCTSLQADNHASTPPLCFLPVGCPSSRPTNSIKALKARIITTTCGENTRQE